MILSALIAASVLLADVTPAAAAGAAAPAPESTPAAAAPAEKPPEGRLVCRSESQPGSLIAKKTCVRVAPKPTAAAKATETKSAPAPSN